MSDIVKRLSRHYNKESSDESFHLYSFGEIREGVAEIERLRLDAARYRHIRENDKARVALQGWQASGPEDLDAAIDAARATVRETANAG